MGYFSNGTEGMDYEARVCARCVHYEDTHESHGCAVLDAHLLYNYKECNNADSILHLLIPRSADGLTNEQCKLFWSRGSNGGGQPEPVPVLVARVKAA